MLLPRDAPADPTRIATPPRSPRAAAHAAPAGRSSAPSLTASTNPGDVPSRVIAAPVRFDARRSLAQRLNDTKVTANGTTTYRAYDAATGALSLKTIVAADKSGDTWRYGITGESYTSDHVTKAAGGAIASVTRYHADGTLDYRATYLGDVAKVVETFDAGGDRLQTIRTAADGSRSFHDYVEASDQALVKTNLYEYASTSGGKLTLARAPTVNVVDADGHVLHALDAGAFKIVNGTLTLDTSRVADVLHVGEHAYVDVTYTVTNGSKASPSSFFSVEIDGTLKLEAGTAAADQIDRSAAPGRLHLDGLGGNSSRDGRGVAAADQRPRRAAPVSNPTARRGSTEGGAPLRRAAAASIGMVVGRSPASRRLRRSAGS